MTAAVFFDLDGTLLDTAPDFVTVLTRLLREDGRTPPTPEAIRGQVSNGGRALVRLGFGLSPGEPGFDTALTRLLDAYADHLDVDTVLFPGLEAVLQALEQRQVPWGVVTNKPERFTTPILTGLGLAQRVGPVICPDHVQVRKPDPEGLLLAARLAGVPPERCVYVGDHLRDIEAGRRAGMTTVAACYGYLDAGEDPRAWQADHYIDSGDALLSLLNLETP